jgi:hypothetical protein
METRMPEFPTWLFQIRESSANLYRLTGKDELSGATVDLAGPDPDELLREAQTSVKQINEATARKFGRR